VIVFPCHHTGGRMIDEAVASAQQWMPDEPILVVDSASPNRSYIDRLPDDVTIALAENVNYATGAYWWAHQHTDADFYYLFHDSVVINDDLTDLQARDVTAVRWWPSAAERGWGYDRDGAPLNAWGLEQWRKHIPAPFPDEFQGCFGPMVAVKRHVLNELSWWGLDGIEATDKWQACAMERIWGAALNCIGHDLADGALQGEMFGFDDPYDETRITKRHGDRY
jgi:hypothetical protein